MLLGVRCLVLGLVCVAGLAAQPESIRVGIIGLDTSHVVAFTKGMNDPAAEGALARVRVTAAYPGGSPDIPSSRDRLAGFTRDVEGMGVEIVASIDALLERVDAVLLESVDGRPHLEQARKVFAAKKPVFIDKPLGGSLHDCLSIERLAQEHGVPWFSSSSLRFSPGILRMRTEVGDVLGCDAFGPCTLEPHHPDLFWYGIHGVEILFTIMGTGCTSVTRTQTADFEQVTGVWSDGRIGTFRGLRDGKRDYGALVFGTQSIARSGRYAGYGPLLERIAQFFVDGRPPVPHAETIEIYAFMEAADESARRGGTPVDLDVDRLRSNAADLPPRVDIAAYAESWNTVDAAFVRVFRRRGSSAEPGGRSGTLELFLNGDSCRWVRDAGRSVGTLEARVVHDELAQLAAAGVFERPERAAADREAAGIAVRLRGPAGVATFRASFDPVAAPVDAALARLLARFR